MDRQDWLKGTLYRPDFEQDSCGFGLIAQIDRPARSPAGADRDLLAAPA
jgi:glutamate synthase domain-containing protein 1